MERLSNGPAAKPASPRQRPFVLLVGNSYYNNWYLAGALRKLGWRAETVTFAGEGADQFLHGYDHKIDNDQWQSSRAGLAVAAEEAASLRALYDQMVDQVGGLKRHPLERPGLSSVERALLKAQLVKTLHASAAAHGHLDELEPLFDAIEHADVLHFTGVRNLRWFYFFNLQQFGHLPIYWDIDLLRLLGKRIVYSNTLCLDGVAQSSLARLGPFPVCDYCRHKDEPEVCSDRLNLQWGQMRNRLVDYQIILGGNRADYNADARVHEVPEFYCLDPDFWRPDLPIPPQYRVSLPAGTVKIYHAVGNFETRSTGEEGRNIKCTHIYRPLIERLKSEGLPVEMIFCSDVPNRDVRYYQAQADIVVDMLTFGFFGANVREAMMLGKPTICYLRPEWLANMRRELPDYVDELPVVSATPYTIYPILKELIQNPAKRAELGRRSRAFALKWHSSEAAGRRLAAIYSSLLERRHQDLAA